jgi:mannose-1-phosphate guanylyltransferase/mannose-6-phosphate isomerase
MIPVILSGGSGTRLWPVSRASYPKQFCEFYDGSFLNNTIRRLKTLGDPYILTVRSMESLTQRAAKAEGIKAEHILFEPMSKNTAPAIALLCHVLISRGLGEEIAGVFPSDHLIKDEKAFAQAVKVAEEVAKTGMIVTLGITPQGPSTGYGYIEVKPRVLLEKSGLKAFEVNGFKEKPDETTAKSYLKAGRYYWNAGMFLFRVKDMAKLLSAQQPALWQKISAIASDLSNADYNYALVDKISLDYAVMEKAKNQACVPCDIGWSDVGSWDELARLSEEFTQLRSQSKAEVFSEQAANNYVFTVQDKVVGLVGVQDLMVVDTPDALLVVKKGQSQKVKELLGQIQDAGLSVATEHQFETRPWGGFKVLADEPQYKCKIINVDPGGQLSYQSHTQRAEQWTVVQGTAEVTLNDKKIVLEVGQTVVIPVGAKHRVKNPGKTVLIFVEVQTGTYFGEDDITRYKDDYNRAVVGDVKMKDGQ